MRYEQQLCVQLLSDCCRSWLDVLVGSFWLFLPQSGDGGGGMGWWSLGGLGVGAPQHHLFFSNARSAFGSAKRATTLTQLVNFCLFWLANLEASYLENEASAPIISKE